MAEIIIKAWKDGVAYLMGLGKKIEKKASNLETNNDLKSDAVNELKKDAGEEEQKEE